MVLFSCAAWAKIALYSILRCPPLLDRRLFVCFLEESQQQDHTQLHLHIRTMYCYLRDSYNWTACTPIQHHFTIAGSSM